MSDEGNMVTMITVIKVKDKVESSDFAILDCS